MRKAGNLAIWVIISVIAFLVLFNIYNKYNSNEKSEVKAENKPTEMNEENNENRLNNIDEEKSGNESNEINEASNENKSNEEKDEKIIAPDFTLEDINGKKVSLSDYRGKIVFLNFWATWCQYCVLEMPDLEKVHREFSKGDDAVVLTVNSDGDPDKVRNFIEDNDLTLPVLMDYAYEVNTMYGISGIPVTFVIGRDGSVYGAIPGMTNKDTLLNIYESIK